MADDFIPAPSSYPLADIESIGIQYCQVLARPASPRIRPALNPTPYTSLGECDYFKWSLNTTYLKMNSKSQRVSVPIKNSPIRIEASASFKTFNLTDFIRAYAMAGKQIAIVQAAAQGLTFSAPAQNGLFRVGRYNISNGLVKLGNTALSESQYSIVDEALGVINVEDLTPQQIAGTDPLNFTFDCADYSKTKTKAGMVMGKALEFLVRGVSDEGVKGVLQLLNCPFGPKGDMDQIAQGDTAQSVELEGAPLSAVDDEGDSSLGSWNELDG